MSFGAPSRGKVFFQSQLDRRPPQPVSFKSTTSRELAYFLKVKDETRAKLRAAAALRKAARGALVSPSRRPERVPQAHIVHTSNGSSNSEHTHDRRRTIDKTNAAAAAAADRAAAEAHMSFDLDRRSPRAVRANIDAETPFDLKHYKNSFPEHQLNVLSDTNYKPDPKTGLSRWPIPGMQGARSPWHDAPFADEGNGDEQSRKQRWQTVAKADTEKGLGVPKPFVSGHYSSEGFGCRAEWNSGNYSLSQLLKPSACYEESGLTSCLLPGRAGAKERELNID